MQFKANLILVEKMNVYAGSLEDIQFSLIHCYHGNEFTGKQLIQSTTSNSDIRYHVILFRKRSNETESRFRNLVTKNKAAAMLSFF